MTRRWCANCSAAFLADEAGFEVMFARDGVEALAQLESFRPDVITLDVNMPQDERPRNASIESWCNGRRRS